MAIDLKKMREKQHKQETKNTGAKTVNWWKPILNVDTIVRILPTEDGDPFKEFFTHYLKENQTDDKGKTKEITTSVFCPKKNLGESCAICDLVSKLYKNGGEDDRKFAKEITAKQRFFSAIIVRGEEEKGVHVWGYPQGIYNKLIKTVLNPEIGDITDPTEGYDLTVTTVKPAGKQYPEPEFETKRKASSLSSNKEMAKSFLNHGIDFDTLFERKTSGQVAEILDTFLNGGSDEGGDFSESTDSGEKESDSKDTSDGEVVDLDTALKGLGV